MNILIISGFFYPENTPRAFRTAELVKEFIRLGHRVKLIIPQRGFCHDEFKDTYPVKIEYFKDTKERRDFVGISLVDRVIFRILNQCFDYPKIGILSALKPVLKKEKAHYDLLLTIAVPHQIHWAVAKVYKKGHKLADKWIADCGDPFMLSESGNYRPMPYFKGIEKCWCRMCDYITVPTEASYKGYYPEFHSKVRVIPQAFNFDEIELEEYKPNAVPTFIFSGVFIKGKRDPRPILRYLETTGRDFRAIFYINQIGLISDFISVFSDKLVIRNYIPRLELIKELSKVDFLLNIENGVEAQTPSKLIDYALSGRPILSLNSQNLDTNKIDQFLNGDYSQQYVVKNIQRYNIKTVAQQFLDLAK